MILTDKQRCMTWTWNNHSKPIRVILDFEKTRETLLEELVKESNIVEEFKDDPIALKMILEDFERKIGFQYHCYLMERDEGGSVEVQTGRKAYYDSKI